MTKKILALLLTATLLCTFTGCGKVYTYEDVQSAYNQGYDDGYADAGGYDYNAGNNNASAIYNSNYEQGYSDGYADCKDGYAYEDAYYGNTEADKGYGDGYYDGWHDCQDGY